MKLTERLYIGNTEASVISAHCYLTYRTPGAAKIVTDVEPKLNQIIAYECGYNNELQRYFMGYIESYKQVNKNEYSIFSRELTAQLKKDLPVFFQHITLTELLAYITATVGLEFVTPNKAYASNIATYVVNHKSGYALLDRLGELFGIEKYFWQQQGNGKVFVGSWYDSVWSKINMPLPADMMTDVSIKGATIPMIPTLRPGVIINSQRIRNIDLQADKMKLTWMSK